MTEAPRTCNRFVKLGELADNVRRITDLLDIRTRRSFRVRISLPARPPNVSACSSWYRDAHWVQTQYHRAEVGQAMLLNVLDFPTPKDALTAAVDGDSVYFPGVAPYLAPPEGWQITKSIEIFGDGPANLATERGTILKPNPATGAPRDVFQIVPDDNTDLANVEIRDLSIKGSGAAGIGIHHLGSTIKKLSAIRISRAVITLMGNEGISLIGFSNPAAATGHVQGVLITETEVSSCGGTGLWTNTAFQVHVERSRFKANAAGAVLALSTELSMYACDFDSNGKVPDAPDAPGGPIVPGEAMVEARSAHIARFDACRFAGFSSTVKALRLTRAGGGCIGACSFELATRIDTATAISLADDEPTGAFTIMTNRFRGVGKALAVDAPVDSNRGCVVFPQAYDLVSPGDPVPTITLPSGARTAPLAVPGLNGPSTTVAGILVPVFDSNPSAAAIEGSICFVQDGSPSLRVISGGLWLPIEAL